MSAPVIELVRCELHETVNCDYCRPRTKIAGAQVREWVEKKHHSACPGCGRRVVAGERVLASPVRGAWRCVNCAR